MKTKVVVVAGQNQVELQDTELDTASLGEQELLIETECTFISAGTELANYTGKDPNVFCPGSWCAYPWRSGYANVGVVRDTGSAVTRATVGQRVFTYGGHASTIRVSQGSLVTPVPEGMDPGLAAASRMASVALTSMIVSEIRGNPWVAVYGLGMVGIIAGQAFGIRGCRVIGIDPLASRCARAAKCGFDETICAAAGDARGRIADITGDRLAEISVEATGLSAVAVEAIKATASHGQLILVGSPRTPFETDVTEFLSAVHLRWVTVRGALEWCLPMYSDYDGWLKNINPLSQEGKQRMIFDWMERGLLKIEPLISHRMKPEQIKEAYEGLLRHPDEYTGVLLDWR